MSKKLKLCRVFRRINYSKVEYLILLRDFFQRADYEKVINIMKKIINNHKNDRIKICIELNHNDKKYLTNCLEQSIMKSVYSGEMNYSKEVVILCHNLKIRIF